MALQQMGETQLMLCNWEGLEDVVPGDVTSDMCPLSFKSEGELFFHQSTTSVAPDPSSSTAVQECITACTSVPGYNFTHAKISNSANIGAQQVGKSAAQLAKLCANTPKCVGFTSSGWLKSSIKIPGLWDDWGTAQTGPCDGQFVLATAKYEGERGG